MAETEFSMSESEARLAAGLDARFKALRDFIGAEFDRLDAKLDRIIAMSEDERR